MMEYVQQQALEKGIAVVDWIRFAIAFTYWEEEFVRNRLALCVRKFFAPLNRAEVESYAAKLVNSFRHRIFSTEPGFRAELW
jgi:hypothetical protein